MLKGLTGAYRRQQGQKRKRIIKRKLQKLPKKEQNKDQENAANEVFLQLSASKKVSKA